MTIKKSSQVHTNGLVRATIGKKMRRSTSTLVGIIAICIAVQPESAQAFALITSGIPGCDFATGNFGTDCVPNFIAHVIRQIFTLSGGLSLIAIIWGGYEVGYGGLIGGKEKGMTRIRWGITGMVVSAFSLFILSFIAKSIAT